MPLSPEDRAQQLTLLNIHRRSVTTLERQYAMHESAYVPPVIIHGIRENLDKIARIKEMLRADGQPVADMECDTFDLSAVS